MHYKSGLATFACICSIRTYKRDHRNFTYQISRVHLRLLLVSTQQKTRNMPGGRRWLDVLLVVALAGAVRGGLHVVKVIVLAGLGLAGMWMLHTLAQDYDKISNKFMFGSSSKAPVGKRSTDTVASDIPGFPQLKWDTILKEDPENCVPSFICQLAAIPYEELKHPERNILKLIRSSQEKNTRSSKIVQIALKLGENYRDVEKCRIRYASCPYTSEAIVALLQTYGGTS